MEEKAKSWSRRRIDLTGQRFGQLLVTHKAKSKSRRTRWICMCDCGKKKGVLTQHLRNGDAQSCGCLRRQSRDAANFKHGSGTNRLYRIWRGVMSRSPVIDERVRAFYRGPGTHDPSWDSYEGFAAWASGSGYAAGLTIDRIDNSGGYWPDNCRWATVSQQANNKTNNVMLEIAGRRLTAAQAAREYGLDPNTIRRRMKAGWPANRAVLSLSAKEAAELNRRFHPAKPTAITNATTSTPRVP